MDRDIGQLTFAIESACVKDDPPQWERRITEWETTAAALKDTGDRDVWVKYLANLRAFVKSHLDGVPGIGTYAELTARYTKLKAEIDAAKPTAKELPTDPAAAKQIVDGINTYKAKLAEASAVRLQIDPETRCDKLTGDWEGLKKIADSADRDLASYVSTLIGDDARLLNQWASNQPRFIEQGPGADWSQHTLYVGGVLESIGKIQKFQPKVDVLVVLAPLSSDQNHIGLVPRHAAQAKEFVVKHVPLARKLVGEVMIPKGVGDAARVGELKKFLATYSTGKQLGKGTVHKVATENYKENEGGKTYQVVKKSFSGHYAWKPVKPQEGTPTIDGVNPEELCELWSQTFIMYEKAGPSRKPFKKWRGTNGVFMSSMLCANKDKISKLVRK